MIDKSYIYKTKIDKRGIAIGIIVFLAIYIFILIKTRAFDLVGLSIGILLFSILFFTSQAFYATFYVYHEYLLINRPLRFFFYKNHIIRYDEIIDISFRTSRTSRDTNKILVRFKTKPKRKGFQFIDISNDDIQNLIDKLKESGVIVNIETGPWQ